MRTKVLSVAGFVLVVMIGLAVQWRYDEAPYNGRKMFLRTNRFTGETQRLTESGWLSTQRSRSSNAQPTIPRYTTDTFPACNATNNGAHAYDTTVSLVKTCNGAVWFTDDNPYLAILARY